MQNLKTTARRLLAEAKGIPSPSLDDFPNAAGGLSGFVARDPALAAAWANLEDALRRNCPMMDRVPPPGWDARAAFRQALSNDPAMDALKAFTARLAVIFREHGVAWSEQDYMDRLLGNSQGDVEPLPARLTAGEGMRRGRLAPDHRTAPCQ